MWLPGLLLLGQWLVFAHGAQLAPGAFSLANYKLCRALTLSCGEASGATYDLEKGTWWVLCGHRRPALLELTPALAPLRVLYLPMADPEAVAYGPLGRITVTDESNGALVQVNVNAVAPGNPQSAVVERTWWLSGFAFEFNKGLEGASYDTSPGLPGPRLLVAQEESPERVLSVDPATGQWQELFSLKEEKGSNKASQGLKDTRKALKDFSDLWVAPGGRLFILSQETRTVGEVDRNTGALLQSFAVGGARPEGLAFTPDGSQMLVVSEGETDAPESPIALYALQC